MRRTGFFLLLLFSFSHTVSAQREQQSLDAGWTFQFGHAALPEKDFNFSLQNLFVKSGAATGTAIDPRFDDSRWRRLDLPHDWAVELPFVYKNNFDIQSHGYKPVGGYFPETSIGWYRKRFTIPRSDSGRRLQLQFDGVFRHARCWFNGFYLGLNESGYIGVNYDITDYVNYDRENVLVVRVDATQYEGWFYEGAGIYRHVWLNKFSNLHLGPAAPFVYSSFQGDNATVHIEATVENKGLGGEALSVVSVLTDRDGKQLARTKETPLRLSPLGSQTVQQSVACSKPRRWSLEDPYLYRVTTLVLQKGKVVDSIRQRIGIRQIEIRPDGLLLNGKKIKLQGVNNHQDHAGLGSALPDYLQYYRVRLMKRMGVNAWRTSHHPPTPELLDACDSLGMLVMDEQRLLNSSPEYLDQFERMILRDRSRACVFIWSIGNEEGWIQTNSTGKRIAQTFVVKQRELDPSRTCTYAADVPNVYQGINEVMPVRSFNYRHTAVADYHRDHPEQPIIGTEMGSTVSTRGQWSRDSIRGYLTDQDIHFPWWASRAEDWWKLAAVNDFWLGGFIWTGFDYRGEPTPFTWPNINSHFGILDMCGFPKNLYYYYKSWWTDKDVLHISPHWNFREKGPGWNKPVGDEMEVWVNSNADSVELILNGKNLGRKIMPRNGHLNWTLYYEPGKLEAIGYKKGRKLYQQVETTGLPVEVVVTPYKTTLLADGQDATVLNVVVLDREGREVPDADNLISFRIEGPGKMIGVGNGDPSSHEPDKCADGNWQRRLFNGKCQLIIQSGTETGMIKVEATAKGLWAGGTDIQTITPASVQQVTADPAYRLTAAESKLRTVEPMLGADISFLPELEDKGMKFSENGVEKDAVQLLRDHGFNYVRLRIFHDPAADSGYSPGKGFCDLSHTLQMAKRVKAAGMKLLLDFHYSDYWADPGKQYKPKAWRGRSFPELKKAVYDYTREVMLALQQQGTLPDMVQVGNEINHGIIWPEGNVANFDGLAALVNAGTKAVKSVHPDAVLMLHVALGGQNDESVFFIDQMKARGVHFDVIGQSYYPKWHGTLEDLEYNLEDLSRRYDRDVIVVEYSHRKAEVNKIAFEVPGGRGKGTCIWEPLSTWEKIFDEQGRANHWLGLYDTFQQQYLKK